MDSANQFQNNVEEHVSKICLSPTGERISEYHHKEVNRPTNYCGSCYDASQNGADGKPICCNSCSSVFGAYEHKKLPPPDMNAIQQCIDEDWPELISKHTSEGCLVSGRLSVNKVPGNFHFAPGKSFDAYNYHLHDVRFLSGLSLDFGHIIHHLSFGDQHPELSSPLDNSQSVHGPEKVFKYHIKVVASEFRYLNGQKTMTNQFAVTKSEGDTASEKISFPSVFFNYDISPMIVIYTEHRKPFTSFLTSVCAIIGGVYTIAAILDTIIFSAERRLKEKSSLGKTR